MDYKYDESDRYIKMLEAKVTNAYEDIDEHKVKLDRDEKKLKDHVNSFKSEFKEFKAEFDTRFNLVKSLSGVTAHLLESVCIKAFLEEAANEEYENEVIRRSQLKNFAIENSLPSLNRNFAKSSLTVSNKAMTERLNPTKRSKSQLKTGNNESYQEIYVYREVTKDIVENVYYRLINNATAIFNQNIDFKKMGYGLGEVFDRAMKRRKDKALSIFDKSKPQNLPHEVDLENMSYADPESVRGSKSVINKLPINKSQVRDYRYGDNFKLKSDVLLSANKLDFDKRKHSLQRKFNNSTIQYAPPTMLELNP